MKQIIIISLVVIGVIGAAVAFSGDDTVEGSPSNNFYGQESSEVVITEYGDFECPACAQFYPIVDEVKKEFEDQIRFEFKHFPLVQIHPNAIAAHRAAQAAANQGKFWEMHDLLYQRQNTWRSTGAVSNNPREIFEGYASELELDLEQYKEDVSASETIGTINADIAMGREVGAESTPTFLLNGEIISDTNQLATVDGFIKFVREALGEIEDDNDESNEPADSAPEAKPEETTE